MTRAGTFVRFWMFCVQDINDPQNRTTQLITKRSKPICKQPHLKYLANISSSQPIPVTSTHLQKHLQTTFNHQKRIQHPTDLGKHHTFTHLKPQMLRWAKAKAQRKPTKASRFALRFGVFSSQTSEVSRRGCRCLGPHDDLEPPGAGGWAGLGGRCGPEFFFGVSRCFVCSKGWVA